jgi:hypothetical protein
MLGWEPQPNESSRAYHAFQLYRDLGPDRTLRQAASLYYHGTTEKLPTNGQLANLKKWSAKHSWLERVRALEVRDAMIARDAIEEHFKSRAADFAERQVQLREQWLENAEKAARQVGQMLDYPLTTQRIVRDEDGEQVTYIFRPAGWSKSTAATLQTLSVTAASGAVGQSGHEDHQPVFNFDALSDEELKTFMRIYDKGYGGLG